MLFNSLKWLTTRQVFSPGRQSLPGQPSEEECVSTVEKLVHFIQTRPFYTAHDVKKALANGKVLKNDLVWSLATEKLFDDYLRYSYDSSNGLLMVVYEKSGSGKSCGLEILCRSKTMGSPKKFAIFPKMDGDIPCGDIWYENLLFSLGLPKETLPLELARDFSNALKMADETDPDFRIRMGGTLLSPKPRILRSHRSDQRPVVVLEDLNPRDLMKPWGQDDPTAHDERIDLDITALGKAFGFIAAIMNSAEHGNYVAFVTTQSKRVADVLQNMQGRVRIAPSLNPNDSEKVDFDNCPPNYGFGWDVKSREAFLRTRFSEELTANTPKLSHELIQSAAESTSDSIREIVERLASHVCTPTKVPRSRTEETDDLGMDDDYSETDISDRLV